MNKLLITGALGYNRSFFDELERCGYDILYVKDERSSMPIEAYEAEAIICNGLFLYHPIEKFKNLKFIQLTSAGFDRVPMDYAEEHGIKVYNARGVYGVPMAEFVLAGILGLYKNSRFFYNNQHKCEWVKDRGLLEIYGKNVLIVGAGNIGGECAKRLSAFGAHVVGVDLYPREDADYDRISPLSEIAGELSVADIVILTLPLTEETRGLFDKTLISRMKQGAILANIARGAVIDTAALVSALSCGHLGGAVLDVFDEEPLPKESPLWKMENVILTPHNSFVGDGNAERLQKIILENINRGLM